MFDENSIRKLIRKLTIVFSTWFNNLVVIILASFIGGALYQCLYGWIKPINVGTDAVAIANTYIVFTTIIFVGVTVILAIAGYIFTLKISESQEAQETRIVENLIKDAKKSEQLGTKLVAAILDNGDVQRMISDHMQKKALEVLKTIENDEMATAEQSASKAQSSMNRANAAQSLSGRIGKNGGHHDRNDE